MKRGELLLEFGSSRVSSGFLSREAFVCPLLDGCLFGGPAKGAGHTATGRGGEETNNKKAIYIHSNSKREDKSGRLSLT